MSEYSLFFSLLLVISAIAFAFLYRISVKRLQGDARSVLYFSFYFLLNAFGFAQFLIGELIWLTASGNAFFILATYALVHGIKCRKKRVKPIYADPLAMLNVFAVFAFTWSTLAMELDIRTFRVGIIAVNIGAVYLYGAVIASREKNVVLNTNVLTITLLGCAVLMSLSWLPLYLTDDGTLHLRAIFAAITLSIFLVFGGLLTRLMTDVVNFYYRTSITDTLSRLYNRRYLMEEGEKLLAKSTSRGFAVSCVMCDIDHFKRINDEYGHDVGDKVISAVAELLYNETRARDIAARFGGEEFVILLNGSDKAAAIEFSERVRVMISELKFADLGLALPVHASFGVAESCRQDLSELLKQADKALYRAKDDGRNRVVAFDSGKT